MRQFPRERGFLLVSSLWGCPRRWFRVKQGGSRSSAPEQGIFGEEPDPHPRHLHQTIFHLFKNKRKKNVNPPHSPKLEPETTTALGATAAPLASPHPHKGVLSPLHIKWDLPPDPEPCACLSRGLSRPFAPPFLLPYIPPPPRKPSKTITSKSNTWHRARFSLSSFSGK